MPHSGAVSNEITVTATTTVRAGRLVTAAGVEGSPGSVVIGIALNSPSSGETLEVMRRGTVTMPYDDAAGDAFGGNYAKCASSGLVAPWGPSTSFTAGAGADGITQPSSATTMEIYQSTDVLANRGTYIIVYGSNGAGAGMLEYMALDSTNTATVVAGAQTFTKVSGLRASAGIETANVHVRMSGGGAEIGQIAAAAYLTDVIENPGDTDWYYHGVTISVATGSGYVSVDSNDNVTRIAYSSGIGTSTAALTKVDYVLSGESPSSNGAISVSPLLIGNKVGRFITGAGAWGTTGYLDSNYLTYVYLAL